ncbi:phosphotransferase enzyme family protein [Frankia sp. R82]|uniref:phosphotransferase enzyme family protein n=1 Tax=Frankia sp. R82 TaxID=2950553 RepID=UPI002044A1AC|nr:aminoglycoside phosphotransferase family protein [Frankia sp. R82]MCM3884304.1 aminoglycoside phosphotransferase family protein [Frankia sp. R82]
MNAQSRPRTSDSGIRILLQEACKEVGIPVVDAELLREGENTIFRLPGRVVVRISRRGQEAVARKEIAVSRWLEANNLSAVRVLPEVGRQPVIVEGRAVTFWQELPGHRHGTPGEVAKALHALHALPPPRHFELGPLSPMARLRERIEAATTLDASDRQWLRSQVDALSVRYDGLAENLSTTVVHGDAWGGNVVVTEDGETVLIDLERCSVGPREWDLVSTAIKYSSFDWITRSDYVEFVDVYGYDVAAWSGFEVLRDIRELRMACYVAQQAASQNKWADEARTRVQCLRGLYGPRPWLWRPAL